MSTFDLHGVVPPVVTPLADDGSVDHDALKRLIDSIVGAGAAGAFVLGSSGEGPWFPIVEQARVVRSAAAAASGRIPVLVGVLEASTERVLEAADRAAGEGADAIVATTPYYFASDGASLERHFERILDRASLPVVLYNIPQMTHNRLDAAIVEPLLDAARLVGIKDSSGDDPTLRSLLDLKVARPSFRVLQGAERGALTALRAGADGIVPGLGNLATRTFVELADAVASGRDSDADALQRRIDELWTLHERGPWLACLKFAVSVAGYGSGRTLAGDRLDEGARAQVAATYQRYVAAEGRAEPTTDEG